MAFVDHVSMSATFLKLLLREIVGESKKRKESGEIDFWYHGTDEYFVDWASPPVNSKYKPELLPHPFISLSRDKVLAAGASEVAGGLCRAELSASAKVLDLRRRSADSRAVWTRVIGTDVGAVHALLKTFESWSQACASGEVLRLHTSDQSLLGKLGPLQNMAMSQATPLAIRIKAHLEVQNFTRAWINTVITPARDLGYQAVICAEVDRYRPDGKKACLNLHVFDPAAISPPDWISKPNEELMAGY